MMSIYSILINGIRKIVGGMDGTKRLYRKSMRVTKGILIVCEFVLPLQCKGVIQVGRTRIIGGMKPKVHYQQPGKKTLKRGMSEYER
jgi:hypothetical protein